ncbi:MAG: WbuC family cupin fold metalloprotein [Balneolaceae bacterium]|nr:WbuC family cupin fold metalloprotein [Balneolaceae bacterium]
MTKLAFENISGDLFELTDELIENGLKASRESERLRMILPLHRSQEAEVQRMLNFLQPGTYVRPHYHPVPHATESIVVLRGSIRFFTHDDKGEVKTVSDLSAVPVPGLVDIEPNVWHSFLVLKPDTILFEAKKGPYNAQTDKAFASWSPAEGSPEVSGWLRSMSQIRK